MSAHAYATRRGPRVHAPGAGSRAGVLRALWIAALCLLALALIWLVAELVPQAQARDSLALRDFTLLSGPHVSAAADFLLRLLDPGLLALWGTALVACALAQARPRVALAVALVLALAPLSADLLKPLLAHPHSRAGAVHINAASWPSGHATAALALALCAVLVAAAPAPRDGGARGGVLGGRRLFAADPRLAYAERCARGLRDGGAVDGARGRGAACQRCPLAAARRRFAEAEHLLAARRRRVRLSRDPAPAAGHGPPAATAAPARPARRRRPLCSSLGRG